MPLTKIGYADKISAAQKIDILTDKLNEALEAVNKIAQYNRIIVGEDPRTEVKIPGTTNYVFANGQLTRRTDIGEPVADGDQQLPKDDGKAGSD